MILNTLILLQVLDILSTWVALRNPKLTEGNSFLKPLMDKVGILPTLLVIKLAFIGFLFWAAPQVPVEVLYVLMAFYGWVVYNNIRLIRGK